MGMREDTHALNNISIKVVGELLGVNLPVNGSTHCPFHDHDDNNPSFSITQDGRRWKCYGCDRHGGAIDLVKEYQGTSFRDAKTWLARASNLSGSTNRSRRSPASSQKYSSLKQNTQTKKMVKETKPDHELYAALLSRSPIQQSGMDYLIGRGLKPAIIERFAIGQMPNESVFRDMVKNFEYTRIEDSGLLTKQSKPSNYHPIFPVDALLFPYFEAELPSYLQARIIEECTKSNRWRNLNKRRGRTYNTDILKVTNIERVAICEGAMDVLSATQLGCEAIGLIGTSARLSDEEMTKLRDKQVDLYLDWDDSGEACAAKLTKDLIRFGVAATRKSAPPNGAKDINEYLQQGYKSL